MLYNMKRFKCLFFSFQNDTSVRSLALHTTLINIFTTRNVFVVIRIIYTLILTKSKSFIRLHAYHTRLHFFFVFNK